MTPSMLGGSFSPRKRIGDQFGGVGRAVAGRDDCDVVARSDAAVFADITHERGHVFRRRRKRHFTDGELISEFDFFERNVVGVEMFAGFDRLAGKADPLSVPEDMLPAFDVHEGDLVSCGNVVLCLKLNAFNTQRLPGRKRHARDGHVIAGMQVNGGVFCRRQFLNFE